MNPRDKQLYLPSFTWNLLRVLAMDESKATGTQVHVEDIANRILDSYINEKHPDVRDFYLDEQKRREEFHEKRRAK
jgi:hypothetical protein